MIINQAVRQEGLLFIIQTKVLSCIRSAGLIWMLVLSAWDSGKPKAEKENRYNINLFGNAWYIFLRGGKGEGSWNL